MKEQNNPQFNGPIKNLKNIWTTVITVIITALIVGGAVYAWQKSNLKYTEQTLQQQITELQSQIKQLQQASQPTIPALEVTQPSSQPSTNQQPTTQPMAKKTIHLYPAYGANPNTQINKIHIISLLFIPKDIDTPIKSEWLANMEKVNSKIKGFFERQFAYNIEITYEIVSQPIKGNLNISEYTLSTLVQEAKKQTGNFVMNNSHNIWMVYLVRDPEYKKNIIGGNLGGLVGLQAATQFEFWLDNEMINSAGLKGSAHEFAHALGIPHPWELSSNTTHDPNYGNVPGDLMGYSNSLELDNLYIRDDVKKEMGL